MNRPWRVSPRALWKGARGGLIMALGVLLAGACGGGNALSDRSPFGPYASRDALVEAVERGQAGPDVFIRCVQEGPVRLEEVTPEAVANYMEALAYEHMLYCVPSRYVAFEEVVLSFETVFEDSLNVFNNWDVYKAFLKQVYGADLG